MNPDVTSCVASLGTLGYAQNMRSEYNTKFI